MPIAVRVVKPEVFQQWADAMKARRRPLAREIIEKAAIEHSKAKVSGKAGAAEVASVAAERR
jgi:hypothetical protein